MIPEPMHGKAMSYIAAGRLRVFRVNGDYVKATCRGSGGAVYDLGYDVRRGGWWCSCPARRSCSHLHALELVTVDRVAR
jgi:uncharacterized Zn finger protein